MMIDEVMNVNLKQVMKMMDVDDDCRRYLIHCSVVYLFYLKMMKKWSLMIWDDEIMQMIILLMKANDYLIHDPTCPMEMDM